MINQSLFGQHRGKISFQVSAIERRYAFMAHVLAKRGLKNLPNASYQAGQQLLVDQ